MRKEPDYKQRAESIKALSRLPFWESSPLTTSFLVFVPIIQQILAPYLIQLTLLNWTYFAALIWGPKCSPLRQSSVRVYFAEVALFFSFFLKGKGQLREDIVGILFYKSNQVF